MCQGDQGVWIPGSSLAAWARLPWTYWRRPAEKTSRLLGSERRAMGLGEMQPERAPSARETVA